MRPQRAWVGLDIGGSKVLAAALDDSGRLLGQVRLPSRGGASGVVGTALGALERLGREAHLGDLAAVGVGVPGLVDPVSGIVSHAVNLGLDGAVLALRDSLEQASGASVVVENDVNAAALGAGHVLGTPQADLAYLSIGTGLAAGVVLDGTLRRGARGAAGEIGHVPVDDRGPHCACGQRGCLEVLASGSAIARRWSGGEGRSPAESLFAAAALGDASAVAVRDDVAGHLARAVRLLVLTVDVDLVVLGGGVAEVGEPLADAVRDALVRQQASSAMLRALDLPARVVLAPRSVPVAAVGAALAGRGEPFPPAALVAAPSVS